MSTRIPLYEEDKDYINEDHISEFAKALVWQDHDDIMTTPATPKNEPIDFDDDVSSSGTEEIDQDTNNNTLIGEGAELGVSPAIKPDMITSKSDWFPVSAASDSNQSKSGSKGKGKTKKSSSIVSLQNEFRNNIAYTLLRWPILIAVFIWVAILGSLYFWIRVHVALKEYFFTWRGERKKLREKLRQSKSYEEWVENAINLDKYLNLDKWSENPKFSYYDYKTVGMTISRLKKARANNNIQELQILLQGCLKRNFAGIENRQLYSHRYYGTKNLVQSYYEEVLRCIEIVTDSNDVSPEIKYKFFKIVSKNFGKSALCLSGGATFAYTHFGVAKALLDAGLLPNIISGTSGGGLIAALLCTRTDEELKKLLIPQLARKITACEDPWYVWIPRLIKTGARFDSVAWARKSNWFTRGSTTFEEAFERTGRKLNISTVPADPHSPVILCNDITSPHCIIWSTLLASSAVPGILNPVVLMMKNPENDAVVPFSLGSKWRDGSLRTDIPIDALNTYYNVNFTVVSQVNPHISLFFFAPKGTVGRPVPVSKSRTRKEKFASFRGGFIAAALEQLLRLEIRKWLQIIKSLDLLPHVLQQDWSNVWLQNFTGSVTIWPRNKLIDFWYILSDPSEKRLGEIIMKGERSMYPKLLYIKNRILVERAIERGRRESSKTMKQARINLEISSNHNNGGAVGGGIEDDDDDDDFVPSDYDLAKFKARIGLTNQDFEEFAAGYGGVAHDGDDEGDGNDDDDDDDDDAFDEDMLVRDMYDDSDTFSPTSSPTPSHYKHRRNTVF
ncbi:hypothetical protein FOB58_000395 [Candida parapsilosis]|uniref:Patatin-like phospholipase domain-containing protein n=2 Tax=Candida parapsilosis TaxID=5480 RepID=G8BDN1_CANPC|nr:uncharacterized protein CPAR2_210230 [Candida parapsilosis]KAF6054473.1 hypothetical protein FOB58_000395 [Candida parapsilosis]KAF6056503.1 hypothetical protein FOB59_001015 [Candida parapsilosis]KAF6059438.1 hypothetical protein FOB60_001020 [Candida parapsilosis]KAF6068191.1 hypothetical protein FOB61_001016 [Candida parapsilosis]KAI5905138.1 Patatin-like phospholipase domain-containing protein [Candida parapsilosis]